MPPPNAEPLTSPTLLQRLRDQGDPLGWPRFVRTYEPLVLAWFRRKGVQDADARDMAQDVFLRFARQAGRFAHDPTRRFRGWLRALTHAVWCDWVERQRPWHRGSGDSAVHRLAEARPAPGGAVDRLPAHADPERLAMAFHAVQGRVLPRTWEAFRLLALEGVSGDEAAARLGMTRGSAHAARCKVQRQVRLEVARLDREG